MSQPIRPVWSKNALLRLGPVVLALIAGITFSIVTYSVFRKLEAGAGESGFKQRAANVIASVRSQTEASVAIVSSVASLYNSSHSVTREEFQAFAGPLAADNPGIQALEWIPRVVGTEREAYERIKETETQSDFRITEHDPQGRLVPAAQRAEYFPVLYVEPLSGNETALGFDIGSEGARLQAVLAARDSGLIRASGPVQLVQEKDGEASVLVLAPVYRRGEGTYRDELKRRRSNLLGFALGAFSVRRLVAVALSEWADPQHAEESGIDLYLYDEGARDPGRLLAFHRTSFPRPDAPVLQESDARSGMHLESNFDVAGRTWTLVARPADGVLPAGRSWVPVAALMVGIAFTGALAAILLVSAHRSRLQDQLVELRSTELDEIHDQLRSYAAERESATAMLGELSQIAKYLSPQLYASISTGERPVRITSHRKKLTVFFADIVQFTNLVDLLAPEDVTRLLNEYLTEMSRIGLQSGGTIDKYIGDGIMMFFGDPESRGVKDDALHCVRMAMAMQKRIRELQGGWEALGVREPLQCRMGISTGYCMVGNFGSEERMQYTILGAGVNLASRLERAAPPGGILVSHETYVLVKDEFRCEEQAPLTVKGFREPIQTYRVIDEWGDVVERESFIREDLPSVKLEVNLRNLTNGDREQAVTALQRALKRLESGDAAPKKG